MSTSEKHSGLQIHCVYCCNNCTFAASLINLNRDGTGEGGGGRLVCECFTIKCTETKVAQLKFADNNV